MPGFMGIRGMEHRNPRDMQRERREEHRVQTQIGLERRSREKVQEILREQEGDMSAYNGKLASANSGECDIISRFKVTEIMTARVAVLSFDDTLLTVQGIFNSVKFRHLPVVDDHGALLGIISDRDCLRMTSPFFGTVNEQNRDKEIMARKVGMIMTRNPVCTTPATSIIEAVKLLNSKKISCLPVVETLEDRKLMGIITWKDVVRAFCPKGFDPTHESTRLKAGVHVNPETSESARLRARTAESARLKAISRSDTEAIVNPAAPPSAPKSDAKPVAKDSSAFDPADMARMKSASGRTRNQDEESAPHPDPYPSDSTVMRVKTSDARRLDEAQGTTEQ